METAGDCYIVASGIMEVDDSGFNVVTEVQADPQDSARRVFDFGKDMLRLSKQVSGTCSDER